MIECKCKMWKRSYIVAELLLVFVLRLSYIFSLLLYFKIFKIILQFCCVTSTLIFSCIMWLWVKVTIDDMCQLQPARVRKNIQIIILVKNEQDKSPLFPLYFQMLCLLIHTQLENSNVIIYLQHVQCKIYHLITNQN